MSRIRIAAVGDIMCGESFYAYGRGPRSQIQRDGAAFLPAEITDWLGEHDLVVGNVECVLSDDGYRSRSLRSHHMRGAPAAAGLLKGWGLSIAALANNHILEHGHAAAVDTAANLRNAGVYVAGAGAGHAFAREAEPLELNVAGVRIGYVAGCLLEEKYAYDGGTNVDGLLSQVAALSDRCDLVIASLHWGSEYMPMPSGPQRELARRFVDAGVHLLLGHHPHVLQGAERVDDALVAYSLGNFVFDQPEPDARWSAMLSCTLETQPSEAAPRCVGWQLQPIVLAECGRPSLAKDNDGERLDAEIRRRCGLLEEPPLDDATYFDQAHDRQQQFRTAMRRRLYSNMRQYPLRMRWQVFARPVLRRLGLW